MIAVYALAAFRGTVEYQVRDTISPRAFPQVRIAVQELFVDPDGR